jgi:hypothetical protein
MKHSHRLPASPDPALSLLPRRICGPVHAANLADAARRSFLSPVIAPLRRAAADRRSIVPTFSDAIAAVRHEIWARADFLQVTATPRPVSKFARHI